jgi:hypothetical protein
MLEGLLSWSFFSCSWRYTYARSYLLAVAAGCFSLHSFLVRPSEKNTISFFLVSAPNYLISLRFVKHCHPRTAELRSLDKHESATNKSAVTIDIKGRTIIVQNLYSRSITPILCSSVPRNHLHCCPKTTRIWPSSSCNPSLRPRLSQPFNPIRCSSRP